MSARSGKKLIDDQDELDYNITFPTPTGLEDSDLKEPVVYLLGWTGSTDKLVAKYSSMYEREGCITLRYTFPIDNLLTSSTVGLLQDTGRKLFQLLDDYDLRENPVMFHIFSNGGAMLYRHTAETFANENVDVIGVVMDSGPSRLLLHGGIAAVYFSQRPKGFFNFLYYLGLFFINYFRNLLSLATTLDFYEVIKESNTSLWPHLFLYSTNDNVVPVKHVIEMAEGRKNAGVALVKTHDFVTSPHVQHLRLYKEEYEEECLQFLEDCLKLYDGEETPEVNAPLTSSVDPVKKRPYSECSPSTSGRKSSLRIRKTSHSETNI